MTFTPPISLAWPYHSSAFPTLLRKLHRPFPSSRLTSLYPQRLRPPVVHLPPSERAVRPGGAVGGGRGAVAGCGGAAGLPAAPVRLRGAGEPSRARGWGRRQRPVPAGAGLPPPSAPGGGAEGPALRVGPAGLGEFPRWGAEPGLGDGGGAVRRFNSSFDFGACVALRSQVSQRRGASELGQAAGSSPSRPSFLHGALLRFGVLPTLSGCPVPEKKKSHSCLECVGIELVLLQLHNVGGQNSWKQRGGSVPLSPRFPLGNVLLNSSITC